MKRVEILRLGTVPDIKSGDKLGEIIVGCAEKETGGVKERDIIVVTSKVVSKAKDRVTALSEVRPSKKTLRLSRRTGKAASKIQLILDDVAAHQVGVALLQQLQQDNPTLWDTITNLPDGIRAAKSVKQKATELEDVEGQRYTQQVLEIEGAQMPMMTPTQEQGIESPFDDPRPGESVVLLSAAGVVWSYAVDNRLIPRSITPSQLITALECEPSTPGQELPEKHNDRVMAGYHKFRQGAERRLGRNRRPGSDSRLRRYLSKYLNLAREDAKDNPEELQRVGVLRQIFLDKLPESVLPELQDIRQMGLEGTSLIRRLEALRLRYHLNPPTEDETQEATMETEVVRIVCSEGLT